MGLQLHPKYQKIMKPFKPILAGVLATPKFPYIGSPKLDGIRCVIPESQPLSRTLKLIPNLEIREVLGNLDLKGLDGELIVGDPSSPTAFKDTTSFVMSKNKKGESWIYWVFDDFTDPTLPFYRRLHLAAHRTTVLNSPNVRLVPHELIEFISHLYKKEESYLKQGFEGIMLRDPAGIYKYGRSTIRENILLKLKRFKDDEATIIGTVELLTNYNPREEDEQGNYNRSSHKENRIPANTLGSLTVMGSSGIIFNIGSGFTSEERKNLWDNRDNLLDMTITYKYFEIGEYDKPRFPIFLGFREVGY